MPGSETSGLRPALQIARRGDAQCRTDPTPARWVSDRRGLAQHLDEKYACAICRGCSHRLLCAAWAFEMEEWFTWGGLTSLQRRILRHRAPELIGEIVMTVRTLIETTDADESAALREAGAQLLGRAENLLAAGEEN